jgi:alcohol dehydrogenase YqhD (iron-dependent ADH family)
MEYVVDTDVMRFAQMASRIWGMQMDFSDPKSTALKGIRAFHSFLHDIGMPINFEELGAKEEDIPILIQKLGIGDGVRYGFKNLDKTDVENIYKISAKATL